MKNWEEVYEKYKQEETRERYIELKSKLVRPNNMNIDEYNELKKMEKVTANLAKVDNIIKYKEKLDNELHILKEELKTREGAVEQETKLKDANAEFEQNEQEIRKVEEKVDELVIKMNETKNKEELEQLKSQRDSELAKLSTLNLKSQELKGKIPEKETNPKTSLKGLEKLSNEEIREKCFLIASTLSKCNVVAGLLMEGASRDSIEVKLEGWKNRKFTSKTPLPLTRKEREDKDKKVQEPKENDNIDAVIDSLMDNHENQALVNKDEFANAFPKLAKRFPNMGKNIFGKALLKVKEVFNRKEEIEEEPTYDFSELKVDTNKDRQKTQKEKFEDFLKYDVVEVAEKGLNQIQEERQKELKQKLEENRKAAMERDEER